MGKPSVYDAPIHATNSSVQDGAKNAKNGGKAKARYPHSPKMPNQSTGVSSGMKRRAFTPGGPAGS